jgi:hypothetical protein
MVTWTEAKGGAKGSLALFGAQDLEDLGSLASKVSKSRNKTRHLG